MFLLTKSFHFVDFGPMEIRVAEKFGQTLKIMWDQAPSCYKIQGFELIIREVDNQIGNK